MTKSTEQCSKCKPLMGLQCGKCWLIARAAKRNAGFAIEMQRTDMQVCALRELVTAFRAFQRAENEFYSAVGYDSMGDCGKLATERGIDAWLEDYVPADGREVTTQTLSEVLTHVERASK